MRKVLLMLAAVLMTTTIAGAGANMLVNGDFEGTGGWQPWWGGNTGIYDFTADYGGTSPNKSAGIFWSDDGWVQVLTNVGPGVYEFGGQSINAAAHPLANRTAQIKAEMGDGANIWWSQITSIGPATPLNVWTNTTGDNIITITSTVPVLKIVLALGDNPASGTPAGIGYFDNVYMTQVPEPASMLLLGLGGLLLRRRK